MNIDFDPEKAFLEIDLDRDGQITAYELFRFMKEVLSVRLPLSDAESVVYEFDGNQDKKLSFLEFQQLVLPATSRSLRDIALNRATLSASSLAYKYRQLPFSTLRQLGDLVEREARFLQKRADFRRQLMMSSDFIKSRYFNQIAQGKAMITVDDIILFLFQNG